MSTDCIFRSETSEETEEDSCSSLEISSGDVLVDVCSDDTTAGQIQDTSDAKGYLPNSIAFKLATEDNGHDETVLKVDSSETSTQRGNASAKIQKGKSHNAEGKKSRSKSRRQGSMRSQHPDTGTRNRRPSNKTDLNYSNTPETNDKLPREGTEYQERVDLHGRAGDSRPASRRRGNMHNANLRAKERIHKRLSDSSSNLEKHTQESSDTKIREGDARSKSRRRGNINTSGHDKEVISCKRLSRTGPGDQDLEDSFRSRKTKNQRQESSGSTKYQENTPTRSKGKNSRSKSRRRESVNNSGHSKEVISSKRRSSTGSADQDLHDYLPQLRNTDNPQENSESSNHYENFDVQLRGRDSRAKSSRRGSMNNSSHHQKANTINRHSSAGSLDLALNDSFTSRRKKSRLRRQESSGSNQNQEKGNGNARERDTRSKSRRRGSIENSGQSKEEISSKRRPGTGPGDPDLQNSFSRKNKDRLWRQESSGPNKYQDNTNTQDPQSEPRSKSRRRWSSMKNSAHHQEAKVMKRRFSTGSVDQDIQSYFPQVRNKVNPQENLGSSEYKEMMETKGRNSRSKSRLHRSMNSLRHDQEDSNQNVNQSLHNSSSSFKSKGERLKGMAAFRGKGKGYR